MRVNEGFTESYAGSTLAKAAAFRGDGRIERAVFARKTEDC